MAEAAGNLNGNKIAKTTKATKSSSKNVSEIVENETKVLRERCISPETRN